MIKMMLTYAMNESMSVTMCKAVLSVDVVGG